MSVRKYRKFKHYGGRAGQDQTSNTFRWNSSNNRSSLAFENSTCIESSNALLNQLNPCREIIPRNAMSHPGPSRMSSTFRTEQIGSSSKEINVSSVQPFPSMSTQLSRRELPMAMSVMRSGQSDTQNDMQMLIENIDTMEAENKGLRNFIAELQNRCSEMEYKEREATERLKQEMMDKENMEKDLQNEKYRCQELLTKMGERLELLKTVEALVGKQKCTINLLQKELEDARKIQNGDTVKELQELKAEVEMIRYEKRSMFQVGEMQRKELEQRTLQVEQLQYENEQLSNEVNDLEGKNMIFATDNQDLKESLEDAQKAKESLLVEIERQENMKAAEATHLKSEIKDLKNELICLQFDMDRTNRESQAVKNKMECLEAENVSLTMELNEAKETVKKLEASLDSCRKSQVEKELNLMKNLNLLLAAKNTESLSMKHLLDRLKKALVEVKGKIDEARLPLIKENHYLMLLSDNVHVKTSIGKLQSLLANCFNELQTLLSSATTDFGENMPRFSDSFFTGENSNDLYTKLPRTQFSEDSACGGASVKSLLDTAVQTDLSASDLDEMTRRMEAKRKVWDANVQTDDCPPKKAKRNSDEDELRLIRQRKDMDEESMENLMQVNRMLWDEVKIQKKGLKTALKKQKEANEKISTTWEKIRKIVKHLDKNLKNNRNVWMTSVDISNKRGSVEEKDRWQPDTEQLMEELRSIQKTLRSLLK